MSTKLHPSFSFDNSIWEGGIFISLDIFQKVRHNKTVETELEAWLTFLSSDDVEDIIELIEKFPGFKPLYETLYRMCENIEGVMNVFSEELYQLDKNTVEFMVDEFSRTIEEQNIDEAVD